jgi:hypothetical protein
MKMTRPFPFDSHPLTRLYLIAARAGSQSDMRQALDIARSLEQTADDRTIAACKLAAEVAIERKT